MIRCIFFVLVVVPAPGSHTATLIFVHGLCEQPTDYEPYLRNNDIFNGAKHIKLILPSAPEKQLTPLPLPPPHNGNHTEQQLYNCFLWYYIKFI